MNINLIEFRTADQYFFDFGGHVPRVGDHVEVAGAYCKIIKVVWRIDGNVDVTFDHPYR